MKRTFVGILPAVPFFVSLAACDTVNPRHCSSNSDCAQKITEGLYQDGDDGDGFVLGADKTYCHPTKHYCYAGCKADADCQNVEHRMNWDQPEKTRCNLTTHHCEVESGDGGVPDLAPSLPLGAVCAFDGECASEHCVEKRCCAELCGEACFSCALPGKEGRCEEVPSGTADPLGRCEIDATCVGGKCVSQLPPGEPCGTNDLVCKSGHCVDGVCCTEASCGECQSCAVSGKAGTCSARPDGPAPSGQCPGDSACGGGQCKGGSCDYRPAGTTLCTHSCAGGSEIYTACTSAHTCGAQQSKGCGFYGCDAAQKACLTSCITHADCVTGSVCDRSDAHQTGAGVCIDPAKVSSVAAGADLQSAISSLGAGVTHLKLGAGKHNRVLSIVGKTVTLVGVPGAIIDPDPDGNALSIGAGAKVTLQGLSVSGATGGASGNGIQCNAAGSPSKVVVVESTIEGNTGMGIWAVVQCDVSIHRSTIKGNTEGGLSLANGTFVVTDSLIVGNGKTASGGSALGGAKLDGSVSFVNNTVADNLAGSGTAGGVICTSAYVLRNSILSGNTGQQYGLCSFDHSDVYSGGTAGAPPGSGNKDVSCNLDASYRPAASSACINAGDGTAPGLSKLDRESGARVKGAAVDLGAYEVQ